ncbi:hypothetical protein BO71DRAFT_251648 [Aspergillus ellipticus CBS 707.79]|uniref:Uncharacterized protein n=1 Tax=Aspergillus ellipticus CBS 707.79 TaxID=1448320 RepID=A0A319D8N7_9EURO|nr:hypothetical protein BO71DRAFT_251648 [Aspergillus ellipticus CBS 707.79]
MAGNTSKSFKKTPSQRSSPRLGSAALLPNSVGDDSDTELDIEMHPELASAARSQCTARSRSTAAQLTNIGRMTSGDVVSRGTQTDPIRVALPRGIQPATWRTLTSAERVPQRGQDNNPHGTNAPRAHAIWEAPTVPGLLHSDGTPARRSLSDNVVRNIVPTAVLSAYPPVRDDRDTFDPHGRRAEPPRDVRTLPRSRAPGQAQIGQNPLTLHVHPTLVEAAQFDNYVNFLVQEVDYNLEDELAGMAQAQAQLRPH